MVFDRLRNLDGDVPRQARPEVGRDLDGEAFLFECAEKFGDCFVDKVKGVQLQLRVAIRDLALCCLAWWDRRRA